MKQNFGGYYRPSKEEFSSIWNECLFVFDTNVLLDLYRYSPSTSLGFLNVLEAVQDRIWLPYQVALEYHENRINIIDKQKKAYSEVSGILNDSKKQLENKLTMYKRHPYLKIQPIIDRIEKLTTSLTNEIGEQASTHPEISDLIEDDVILKEITKLFDNRVGNEYSQDKMVEICKKGEVR